VTSCISGSIFSVKNTTWSTTQVAFEYTAEILNVLVRAYLFTERYTAFPDIFWEVYQADQSTRPTKFYNGYTTLVAFPMYSTCTGVLPTILHSKEYIVPGSTTSSTSIYTYTCVRTACQVPGTCTRYLVAYTQRAQQWTTRYLYTGRSVSGTPVLVVWYWSTQ
jgi:hypothetical protein